MDQKTLEIEEEETVREREGEGEERKKRSEAGDARLGWCCIVCIVVYIKRPKNTAKRHSGLSFAGDGHVMIH